MGDLRLFGPEKLRCVASCPSPCRHNSGWCASSLCLSLCGDLRRFGCGMLCCGSKRSLAKSGCCDGLCTGDRAPLGAGICDPICIGVRSTASPGGSSPLHPVGPGNSPRLLLAAAASITSTNMALSCIAARPARSSPIRSPTSRLLTQTGPPNPRIWAHACWTCAATARQALRSSTCICQQTILSHHSPSCTHGLAATSWARFGSQPQSQFHCCGDNILVLENRWGPVVGTAYYSA